MARLLGSFEHALDDKGRYTVPAKLRDALGREFVAVAGSERCVDLYPLSVWESLEQQIVKLPKFDREAAEIRRRFGSEAAEMKADSQWRVVLPARLKDWAGLTRDVVTVGAFTKCEVWDRAAFAEHSEQLSDPERIARAQQKYPL